MSHTELTVEALLDALETTGIGAQTISGKPYTLGSTSLEDIVQAVNAAQLAAPVAEPDEIETVADRAMDLAMKYSDEVQAGRRRIAELEAHIAAIEAQNRRFADDLQAFHDAAQLAAPVALGHEPAYYIHVDDMDKANPTVYTANQCKSWPQDAAKFYRALYASQPAQVDRQPVNEFEKCPHPECGRFKDGAGWSCRAMQDNACVRNDATL